MFELKINCSNPTIAKFVQTQLCDKLCVAASGATITVAGEQPDIVLEETRSKMRCVLLGLRAVKSELQLHGGHAEQPN